MARLHRPPRPAADDACGPAGLPLCQGAGRRQPPGQQPRAARSGHRHRQDGRLLPRGHRGFGAAAEDRRRLHRHRGLAGTGLPQGPAPLGEDHPRAALRHAQGPYGRQGAARRKMGWRYRHPGAAARPRRLAPGPGQRPGLQRRAKRVFQELRVLPGAPKSSQRDDTSRQPRADPRDAANGQHVDRGGQHAVRVRRGPSPARHRRGTVHLPGPARRQRRPACQPAHPGQPARPRDAGLVPARPGGIRPAHHRVHRQTDAAGKLRARGAMGPCRQAHAPLPPAAASTSSTG